MCFLTNVHWYLKLHSIVLFLRSFQIYIIRRSIDSPYIGSSQIKFGKQEGERKDGGIREGGRGLHKSVGSC